jgi:branched-chain amino acid transport system substrate-binding protein
MARLVALMVVVALVSMGSFGLGSPGARAQAPQVLKVGVPGPMQLPVGQGITYGLTLAAGEINAAGGIMARKITLVPEDEAETPEVGIAAMRKLVESDKVDVMIGGQTSGVVLAQLPQIGRAKTVYLGVGAASPLITDQVKGQVPESL